MTLQWVGAGREVDPLRLEAAVGAAQALRIDDAEAFALALKALGLLEHDDAMAAHALLREVLGPLVAGPARLDAEALRAAADRALDRGRELLGLATRVKAQPEDLWALRALGHTVSLLARLEVEEDWLVLGVARRERRLGDRPRPRACGRSGRASASRPRRAARTRC